MLQGTVKKAIVFIGHSKQGSLVKDGVKLEASDLNLTGKMKLELLRDVDACGFLYRKDQNTVMINFKSNDRDLTIKSRVKHLNGVEFPLTEMNDKGEIIAHWDKIFING